MRCDPIIAVVLSSAAIVATGCASEPSPIRADGAPLSDDVVRKPFDAPQGLARPYDASANLAWSGNGFARPGVARDCIPYYEPIHDPVNVNDGYYGNGSSWISDSTGSWVKVDLGRLVPFDTFLAGRDRTASFGDRSWGAFRILVAATDDAYANGDDANDEAEYALVYDSASDPAYRGWFELGETITATFAPVTARYVKLVVQNWGAAVDEIEIREASKCAPPEVQCGARDAAYCADLGSDPANCGACGMQCPVGDACSNGRCEPSCPPDRFCIVSER